MPKVKTNKTAAKRFKITGKGKLTYDSARMNHLMSSKKDGGRIRRMKQGGVVEGGDIKKIKRLIPNAG